MTFHIEDVARIAHEANRAVQLVAGDPNPSPHWDTAPTWQRESAVEGVRKALAGATAEGLHQSWCESKVKDGWNFGPVKDAEAKTHPCLVQYSELPEGQKAKDHLFGAIVNALAPYIEEN